MGQIIDDAPGGLRIGCRVLHDRVQLGGGVGAAFRQSDTELAAKFDKAIGEMKADGTINTLIQKWFKDKAVLF